MLANCFPNSGNESQEATSSKPENVDEKPKEVKVPAQQAPLSFQFNSYAPPVGNEQNEHGKEMTLEEAKAEVKRLLSMVGEFKNGDKTINLEDRDRLKDIRKILSSVKIELNEKTTNSLINTSNLRELSQEIINLGNKKHNYHHKP